MTYYDDLYEHAVDNYYLVTTDDANNLGIPPVELAKLTISVTKFHLITYIPALYILPPCGQSTDYPHFLYPFPTGTFPETPAVRGMADCIS